MRSRSRIRVPTKKTRSWGINVAVNPVVNLPQTARGPHGGQGRGPRIRGKKKTPAAMCHPTARVILARISDCYHAIRCSLSADAVVTHAVQAIPMPGGVWSGMVVPLLWAFSTKKSASWTAKAAALSLSRLSPNTGPGCRTGSQAMNTENTNGESTPPAITSFSPARSAASSPRK